MEFKLRDVESNPFRKIGKYPINRTKIDALKESIDATGFWDNIVARVVGGKAQIAYGHHRIQALKEVFKPNHVIDLIVRNLTDDIMIKIMARENMEEWGSSASVEHETIRAVVEAFGAGLITLPAVASSTSKNQMRFAPYFTMGDPVHAHTPPYDDRAYTAESLADFIGWMQPNGKPKRKVNTALAALELIEQGVLKDSTFTGLGTEAARVIVEEAARTKRLRDEQAKVAERAAVEMEKKGKLAQATRVKARAERLRSEGKKKAAAVGEAQSKAQHAKKDKPRDKHESARDLTYRVDPVATPTPPRDIDAWMEKLIDDVKVRMSDKLTEKLAFIKPFLPEAKSHQRKELAKALETLAGMYAQIAQKVIGK